MVRRLRTLLTLLLAAGLLAPAGALASAGSDYRDLIKAYQAKGRIDGCKYSAKKLASAAKGVPPDIDTYAPDFLDALDVASRQRASGDCDAKASAKTPGSTTSGAAAAGTAVAAAGSGAAGTPGGGAPGTAAPAGSAPAPGAPSGATGATGAAAAAPATPAPTAEPSASPAAADGSVANAADRTTRDDRVPFPLVLLAVLAGLALLGALLWALARFLAFDPPWLAEGRHATSEAGWRASASWAEFTDWVRLGR